MIGGLITSGENNILLAKNPCSNSASSPLENWIQSELPDAAIVKRQMQWAESAQRKLRFSHICSACGSFFLGIHGVFSWFHVWSRPISLVLTSFFTSTTLAGSFWYGNRAEGKRAGLVCCMALSLGLLLGGCGIGFGISSEIPSATRLFILSASLPTMVLGIGIAVYALYQMRQHANCHQQRAWQLIQAIQDPSRFSKIKDLIHKTLLNQVGPSGQSPLQAAFLRGNVDAFAKYLIEAGANPRHLLTEVLEEAMSSNNFSKLERLLQILPESLKQTSSLDEHFDAIFLQWPNTSDDLRQKSFYQLFTILGEGGWLRKPRKAIKQRILNIADGFTKEKLSPYQHLLQKMGWITDVDIISYPGLPRHPNGVRPPPEVPSL